MNRPRLVREVYFEIHRALAGRASPREILESAAALVDLFTQPEDDGPQYVLRVGGVPFERWALDVAFADGGWRVMSYETHLREDLLEEEAHERWLHNRMARMGMEIEA